jgi:hypothetical protein
MIELSGSLIRGCHPKLVSTTTYDDWYNMSLMEYYRTQSNTCHPNPADYWRYRKDKKWGWEYSVTDYKTQSIKEFHRNYNIIKKINKDICEKWYYINLFFKSIENTIDIPGLIMDYLFFDYKNKYKSKIYYHISLNHPFPLPSKAVVNPMQVFLGRLHQYGFISKKTNTCRIELTKYKKYMNKKGIFYKYESIPFSELIKYCLYKDKIEIIHPMIHIANKETLLRIVKGIYISDRHSINNKISNLLEGTNYNFTIYKSLLHNYAHPLSAEQKRRFALFPSTIDIWISDLFGW